MESMQREALMMYLLQCPLQKAKATNAHLIHVQPYAVNGQCVIDATQLLAPPVQRCWVLEVWPVHCAWPELHAKTQHPQARLKAGTTDMILYMTKTSKQLASVPTSPM